MSYTKRVRRTLALLRPVFRKVLGMRENDVHGEDFNESKSSRPVPAPRPKAKETESQLRPPRPLRLGIDYGTSASKLVVTDYGAVGGDRSFVVRPARQPSDRGYNDYRVPSSVGVTDDLLHFGFAAERLGKDASVYRSLKMLCAYPNGFYGDRLPLPPGLSARDLATLYVGYLVHLGRDAAVRYASRFRAEPSLSMTLGVPMAQLDERHLCKMFVDIARESFELGQVLDFRGAINIPDAVGALSDVRAKLDGEVPDEPRDWVRSEAEAALFWAHRSPDVGDGRFACVDVGAGTTGASWFHVGATREGGVLVPDRLSFYGAACAPPACDAIDQVLAKHLEGANSLRDIRGREDQLIKALSSKGGLQALDDVLAGISRVFGSASAVAFEKEKSVRRWKHIGRVFFLGGGTKLRKVQDSLIEKGRRALQADPIADPGVPTDLTEEDGTTLREDPSFLLVAYGLARRLGDVPDTFTPSEVGDYTPTPRRQDRPSSDDLYSD